MHHETQSTHFAAEVNFAEANLEDTITYNNNTWVRPSVSLVHLGAQVYQVVI